MNTCEQARPQHWGLRPLLFSNSHVGSLTSPTNLVWEILLLRCRRQGKRLNVTTQWHDKNWNKVLAQPAWSYQLFEIKLYINKIIMQSNTRSRDIALQWKALSRDISKKGLLHVNVFCVRNYKEGLTCTTICTALLDSGAKFTMVTQLAYTTYDLRQIRC